MEEDLTSQLTQAVAEPTAPATEEQPKAEPKPARFGFHWGTGRRKSSVARVRIRPGEGKFVVNGKEVDTFFTEPKDQNACRAPLKATEVEGKIDVFAKVHGGGHTGQADAILLGLSRALKDYDPALEDVLRDNSMLTRDPRRVERKKYGQRGARRRFQFSKR